MTDPNDDMLDDLFAQARGQAPQVSEDLMARVLADAAATQGVPSAAAPRPGLWAQLSEMIGGWPAAGGLVAATCAGLWLGFAPPASVETFAASLTGSTLSVDLMSGAALFESGGAFDG